MSISNATLQNFLPNMSLHVEWAVLSISSLVTLTSETLSQQWDALQDIHWHGLISCTKDFLWDALAWGSRNLQHVSVQHVLDMHPAWIMVSFVVLFFTLGRVLRACRSHQDHRSATQMTTVKPEGCIMSFFDLAKTAYEAGHIEALMRQMKKKHYDVNYPMPSSGLTLFLCACISGERRLVKYLLQKGGDVRKCSKEGDGALYLATFGILCSPEPDLGLLQLLIDAGCDVNAQSNSGFTPLHRAASKGSISVIKYLLSKGADPYLTTKSGIYPIDSATNAGHHEAAELLYVDLDTSRNVWNIVEPYTPTRVRLGLQSPCRQHLAQSARPKQTLQSVSSRGRTLLT